MRPAAILIADDDAVSARQLSDILSREGHRVRVVDSGDAALVRVPWIRPTYSSSI